MKDIFSTNDDLSAMNSNSTPLQTNIDIKVLCKDEDHYEPQFATTSSVDNDNIDLIEFQKEESREE